MALHDQIILGIETSCDETSAAVVANGRLVLSNIISSQIDIHKKYGGVVPEIASRKHIETIGGIVSRAMDQAGVGFERLDGIAVTAGPGLVGALLVGLSYGKALAYAIHKPLIGVHHIEGHICANYIKDEKNDAEDGFAPPFVCLVVSGGHTNIVHVPDYGVYDVLGRTRDDAAGEAFDKVARAIGLGYPGGPAIDRLAKTGNEDAIHFPRALLEEVSLDFSFSGLKSAVLNYINQANMAGNEIVSADVAASFQKAVVEVLTAKTMLACKRLQIKKVALAGGVSCNGALRDALTAACRYNGYSFHVPKPIYCTDNAAMIGVCGYYKLFHGRVGITPHGLDLNAIPNLSLG